MLCIDVSTQTDSQPADRPAYIYMRRFKYLLGSYLLLLLLFIPGADLHVGCADTWTVLGNLSTMSAGSRLECTKTQREEANSHMYAVIGTVYFLGHCY